MTTVVHVSKERNKMVQEKFTLKQLRERLGLTQFDLAVKSGVSLKSISNAETGKQNLSILNIQRILKALDVKFDEVLWPETKPDKRIKGNR